MTQVETDVEVDSGRPLPSVKKIALATFVGTAVEWYDYFIYGLTAALVLGQLFFPEFSSTAGTLAAFATFAVGYIARPLGGILMGHFGDRVGRKSMLVISLLTMGCTTVLIGLLPGFDTIGIWAPILLVLLRVIQGIAAGGEWGGAVLVAVENAPPNKRTLYGSFPQMGVAGGLILANLVYLILTTVVSQETLLAWAWRIPFLISALLVIVGLYVRLGIAESPEFARALKEQDRAKLPIVEAFRTGWKGIVLGALSYGGSSAISYIFVTYLLSYAPKQIGYSYTTILTLTLVGTTLWMLIMPFSSMLADRIGRGKVLLWGWVGLGLGGTALMPAADTGSVPVLATAMLVVAIFVGVTYGPFAAFFSDMFPPRVRYSGSSMCYQIGSIVGGGFAPLIAASLFATWGTSTPITVYLLVTSLVGFGTMAILVRTHIGRAADNRPTAGKPVTPVDARFAVE
ncbi:MFS transporter [Nocardia sp. NPDC050378]|uniref:MFS transporter n=1 Tax=Nocardia sp. NPDC050378 TaxID=3155400 RepID=UPI0033D04C81